MIDNFKHKKFIFDAVVVEIINNCTIIINIKLSNVVSILNCSLYQITKLDVETQEGIEAKTLLEKLLPVGTHIKFQLHNERRKNNKLNLYLITVFDQVKEISINDTLNLNKKEKYIKSKMLLFNSKKV